MSRRSKSVSTIIKVYPDIEKLVRYVSEKLGYQPFIVRNTAILYGLVIIASKKEIPDNDNEFFKLIEYTDYLVKKVL